MEDITKRSKARNKRKAKALRKRARASRRRWL